MVRKKRVMRKSCIGCEDYNFCKPCKISYLYMHYPKPKKIEDKVQKARYFYLNIKLDDYADCAGFSHNLNDLTKLVSNIFYSAEVCEGRTVHFKDPILDALLDNIRKNYFRYLKINEENCKNNGCSWFDYNLEVGKNRAYNRARISLEKKARQIIKSSLKRKKTKIKKDFN